MKSMQNFGDETDVPAEVLEWPSMMTLEEKALLYHLARDLYSGEGVIVDAGLFLGASTVAFCRGLLDGKKGAPKCVHSYDIAIWHAAGFDKYLANPQVQSKIGDLRPQHGENYSSLLQSLLSDYLDLVDLRIGDIVREVRSEQAVEIAFYDLLKNYERDWAVFKALGPHYIPGKTVVIQQDYFYEDAYDSRIRQEFLAPHFEFLGSYGSSGVFRLISELPQSYFVEDPVLSLSVDEKVALLRQAAARVELSKYQMYANLAVIRFLMVSGERDRAVEELDRQDSIISGSSLASPRAKQILRDIRVQLGEV